VAEQLQSSIEIILLTIFSSNLRARSFPHPPVLIRAINIKEQRGLVSSGLRFWIQSAPNKIHLSFSSVTKETELHMLCVITSFSFLQLRRINKTFQYHS